MSYRYTLAAVMRAAFALPAAAQQTTPSDTSKKAPTTTTSNGAISDSTKAADSTKATSTVNPTGAPSNGAQVSPTPQPSAGPATTPPAEAAAQATTPPSTEVAPSSGALPAMGAQKTDSGAKAQTPEGQVKPTEAARVHVKVAESLASTVKISGDSAFAIARTSPDAGEVSSADLEMKEGRLVYQVKMVHGKNGAGEVVVDAMTGEILKDKKYGGARAVIEHADESQKLDAAKKDSSETKKP
jgi:uncharacterized membrane protein YkoI